MQGFGEKKSSRLNNRIFDNFYFFTNIFMGKDQSLEDETREKIAKKLQVLFRKVTKRLEA
jgi:hypothetical protein